MKRIHVPPPLPPRPLDGHKGTFGRVLVVGGSDQMLGAPVFVGTAALRCGAGLVQVAVPKTLLPHALALTPELIGLALGDRPTKTNPGKNLLSAAELADVLVVGPGMGVTPDSNHRLRALLDLGKPTVLDADALTLLAAGRKWPKLPPGRRVITPHPGEMKRLGKLFGTEVIAAGDRERIALATRAYEAFGVTVVLKGARTVVVGDGRVFVSTVADSSLAKAGTGDVLAGTLAAMLAVTADDFDAACLAVAIHAQAGVLAGQALGPRSVLARDVIDHLSPALRQHPQA